jgi:hypothetical protein
MVAKNTNLETFNLEDPRRTSELNARDKTQTETNILLLIKNNKKGCNFFISQKYDFLLIIIFIIVAMLNFEP